MRFEILLLCYYYVDYQGQVSLEILAAFVIRIVTCVTLLSANRLRASKRLYNLRDSYVTAFCRYISYVKPALDNAAFFSRNIM